MSAAWRLAASLLAGLAGLLPMAPVSSAPATAKDWVAPLQRELARIDQRTPGRLGVYVKRLDTGEVMDYQADRRWYLGSTTKLPIALAVLESVQAGRLSLTQRLSLGANDRIDGPGPTVWQGAGSRSSVSTLLERMLVTSDNTAANRLMRAVGEDRVNALARERFGADQVGTITDFSQVRRGVYRQFHPSADELSADQLVRLAAAPIGPRRVASLRRALKLPASALRLRDFDQAYERYYEGGENQASLVGYGRMLEWLVTDTEALRPDLRRRLYTDLKIDRYDNYRLEAGLPRRLPFIHKTGTQHRRACHMGVIEPALGARGAIVIAACAEDLDEARAGGPLLQQVGLAINRAMSLPTRPR